MRRLFGPVSVTGTAISIALAAILFAVGISEIESTIVALLGIIIAFQVDSARGLRQDLGKAFQNSAFWHELQSIPWLKEYVEGIIDSATKITRSVESRIFWEKSKSEIERCRNRIKELSQGQLRSTVSESQLMLTAVELS